MGFQSTVSLQQGFGVPGELFNDGPKKSQSYIINSASAAYNIFGTAFSVTSEGNAAAGNTTGALVYAGILVNPKGSASFGTSSGPLNPTLTLANYAQGELLTEGTIIVTLGAEAAIGDVVIFDNTTGVLSTITPGTTLPGGKTYANANVSYRTVTAAGLAVITVSPLAAH